MAPPSKPSYIKYLSLVGFCNTHSSCLLSWGVSVLETFCNCQDTLWLSMGKVACCCGVDTRITWTLHYCIEMIFQILCAYAYFADSNIQLFWVVYCSYLDKVELQKVLDGGCSVSWNRRTSLPSIIPTTNCGVRVITPDLFLILDATCHITCQLQETCEETLQSEVLQGAW